MGFDSSVLTRHLWGSLVLAPRTGPMGWEMCSHTETVIGGISWPNFGPQYCAEDGRETWRTAGRQCHPRKIKVEKETWDGAREEVSWVRG